MTQTIIVHTLTSTKNKVPEFLQGYIPGYNIYNIYEVVSSQKLKDIMLKLRFLIPLRTSG